MAVNNIKILSSPKTILITGATDGIGLALANHYQAQKHNLILIGRQPFSDAPLSQFTANNYCQVDLSRPDCADKVSQWLNTHNINHIDWLIHNAALGYYGSTETQAPENINALVSVNLRAPIALTHKLLPCLRQPNGKTIFISSVVSSLACPEYAVYGATKAALDGFARSLRIEPQDFLPVQVIYPGATQTGIHSKSGLQKDVIDWEKFPPAEDIALKIAKAIDSERKSAVIGTGNRVMRFGEQYSPDNPGQHRPVSGLPRQNGACAVLHLQPFRKRDTGIPPARQAQRWGEASQIGHMLDPGPDPDADEMISTPFNLVGQLVADGEGNTIQGARTLNFAGGVEADTVTGTYAVNSE